MKIKKYMNILFILVLFFVLQIIYIEYSLSQQRQQLTDLSQTLDESIYNFNNRMIQLENEIRQTVKKSFVSSHKIPNKIYFCGDRLNVKDPIVRESVEREFYSLLTKEGQIQMYIKRLKRYTKLIENELIKAGLPTDLKYLSIHESALLPTIRSRSNAVGLWQFMSSSARLYGLKVNRIIDERRDPEKATKAAIRYLKDLYDQFGSWPLALAAYNGGPNRLKRTIERENSNNFYDLSLPEETERYYFKIIATKIIVSNPEKYGFFFEDEDYYHPLPSQNVEFTIYESRKYLDEIAGICNISLAELKVLNPWIKAEYLPAGNYTFKTYKDRLAVFQTNYENYCKSFTMLAKNDEKNSKNEMID